MAATVLAEAGAKVSIFEKRRAPGWKILVAGSSGLNVTNALPLPEFSSHYEPQVFPSGLTWTEILKSFPPEAWIQFIEKLGMRTFKGSGGRWFVEDMKAARFLAAWTQRLESLGVVFRFDQELTDFFQDQLAFASGEKVNFQHVIFALGGGSWEKKEIPLRWPEVFRAKGVAFEDFTASNAGYHVNWPAAFVQEAEGRPIKNMVLTTAKGRRVGELVVTHYGLEGTPVYAVGVSGPASLDLKPDLSVEEVQSRLESVRENLSPARRVKRALGLCPVSQALVFHLCRETTPVTLAAWIKAVPIPLGPSRPLSEAISSRGGFSLSEVTAEFELKKFPRHYAVGEMLDWDAPTGGFLIQACVSQAVVAARALLR